MSDILDYGVSDGITRVKISAITTKEIPLKENRLGTKIIMSCEDTTNPKMRAIDEAWVKGKTGQFENKGLWVELEPGTSTFTAQSAIGKIMRLYGVNSLGELIGKELSGVFKPNGYLALLTEEHKSGNEYHTIQ